MESLKVEKMEILARQRVFERIIIILLKGASSDSIVYYMRKIMYIFPEKVFHLHQRANEYLKRMYFLKEKLGTHLISIDS